MKISLITPAPKLSRAGNRATALRWARFLRRLGHRVRIAMEYEDEAADLLIALHAWRSAESVVRFRDRHPDRPLIVALTGTDIYRFQDSDPEITHRSMELADRLVCLHDLVDQAIPKRFHKKLSVIYQSVVPLPGSYPRSRCHFDVCVIGHLREEKDPMRTALAVRALPAGSRIRVIHLGAAHTPDWAKEARAEMARNPRYEWRGEVPHWRVRQMMARARLMVLSSIMEGGANVISEAVVAGLPVIASDIPGSIGLLGADYPGYYPTGDSDALKRLLLRAESEPKFYRGLDRQCRKRRPLFRPQHEQKAWADLLRSLDMR